LISGDRAVLPVAPPIYKPNPVKKFLRTYLLERTLWSIPRDARVLDLCCGYGFYFTINPHAQGVDGDPKAVTELRSRGHAVEHANVLEGLPFEAESFDYVVAHDVFEHFVFDELVVLVAEIRRVLRPNAVLAVWVPNRRGYDLGVRNGSGHRLYVTDAEIQRLIRPHFRLEKHYPEPFPRLIGRFFDHNKEVFILRRL
jgi:SAM-dependent methyltransferase